METKRVSEKNLRKVFLTFDVEGPPFNEDFLDEKTAMSLYRILRLLEKHEIQGLFFIAGTSLDGLVRFPQILDLLKRHEIGYHSSSHTVEPRILQYTDIESYQKAVAISRERETSCIDPSSGKIMAQGGVHSLRKIFPEKDICCFRAPFLAWSPPHLEALKELGFKFDFSSGISEEPTFYKGITFYPAPLTVDGLVSKVINTNDSFVKTIPRPLVSIIANQKYTTIALHPAHLVHSKYSLTPKGVSSKVFQSKSKNTVEVESQFFMLELLLLQLNFLEKTRRIKITPPIVESKTRLDPRKVNVKSVYAKSVYAKSVRASKKLFDHEPRFILSHFQDFFRDFQ